VAETIWVLLSIFVIAPLGAVAIDRPLFGNWIWRIDPDKVEGPNYSRREVGQAAAGPPKRERPLARPKRRGTISTTYHHEPRT
jgi:hypothetical protein